MIFHLRRMGHRRLFLLSLLLLRLIISIGHITGHAQAAAITQQEQDGVGIGSMMRAMVGSRPPSCAGRCWWCGGRRCVAVQVLITPQQDSSKNSHGAHGRPRSRQGGASPPPARQQQQVSSYDDHSNYKPLSWRCKCGGVAGLKP